MIDVIRKVRLAHCISNRLSREDPSFEAPSAVAVLRDNPYIPPEDLVQLIVNEDEEISLYAVSRLTVIHHLRYSLL